ncbi:MAG TPA: alpha/beta family hydrolase [Actinomycetota bacterium]|nr:alpha/beta family hydrolase [Actinomycetota bacterium]
MPTRKIDTPHGRVSTALDGPSGGPVLALAHGAGGNMHTAFLDGFAAGVAATGVACLRFNFAYAEAGKRSPDREPALRAVWSAAFDRAREVGDPVWAGGKSLGGRIASMMTADGEMEPRGLVLVGYPLHPPGKPERLRDAHLDRIPVPMLFLQGTSDPFATWDLLTGVVDQLDGAVLHPIEGGDHSFRVRGAGRDDVGTGTALGEIAGRFVLER